MGHFLSSRKPPPWNTDYVCRRPYAAVKVELVGKGDKAVLVVLPGAIFSVKPGTYMRSLPTRVPVQGPDGERLAASGEFFITSETVDPYHMLIDALHGNGPF